MSPQCSDVGAWRRWWHQGLAATAQLWHHSEFPPALLQLGAVLRLCSLSAGSGNEPSLFVSAVLRETSLCLHSSGVKNITAEHLPALADPLLLQSKSPPGPALESCLELIPTAFPELWGVKLGTSQWESPVPSFPPHLRAGRCWR